MTDEQIGLTYDSVMEVRSKLPPPFTGDRITRITVGEELMKLLKELPARPNAAAGLTLMEVEIVERPDLFPAGDVFLGMVHYADKPFALIRRGETKTPDTRRPRE